MKSLFITLLVIAGLIQTKVNAQSLDSILTVSDNPFLTTTDLTIHNLTNDTVTFIIVNMIGEIVADFFDNSIITGTYTMTFDADTLPYGVYLVGLTINNDFYGLKIIKSSTASIATEKINGYEDIVIYPNPTTAQIEISTTFNVLEVKLFDLNGKIIYHDKNYKKRAINLEKYNTGQYFLHVITDSKTFVKKIIKLLPQGK